MQRRPIAGSEKEWQQGGIAIRGDEKNFDYSIIEYIELKVRASPVVPRGCACTIGQRTLCTYSIHTYYLLLLTSINKLFNVETTEEIKLFSILSYIQLDNKIFKFHRLTINNMQT